MKRYLKEFGAVLLLVSLPIIIVAILFIIAFSIVGWYADMEQSKIQKEITAYVIENKDAIEIDSPLGHRAFHYTSTGTWDTEVNCGYYYSSEDIYLFTHKNPLYDEGGIYGVTLSSENSTPYKNGYREDGMYGNPLNWYYTEKICANWYYYELHLG